jgi:hypothetical protein
MKAINLKATLLLSLLLFISSFSFYSFGQMKIITNGNIGIGGMTSPTSKMELNCGNFLRFNTLPTLVTTTGILFYDGGTATATDVQHGVKFLYDNPSDKFYIITRNDAMTNYSITIGRSNGNVNIGSSAVSTFKLNVYGDVASYGVKLTSDIRLKRDIQPINNVMSDIMKIQPISFKFIDKQYAEKASFLENELATQVRDTEDSNNKSFYNQTRYGFSAQEIKTIFPDLVTEDLDGTLSIDYIGIIPLLVNAIKEQQVTIEDLKTQIKDIKSVSASISDESELSTKDGKNSLLQNSPNPFSENTKIEYSLSDNINSAAIFIYDMNGSQIKSFPLNSKGHGNIVINGNELQAGMYLYSLIANGNIIDIKRMILTK